jgi:hypothetical protein
MPNRVACSSCCACRHVQPKTRKRTVPHHEGLNQLFQQFPPYRANALYDRNHNESANCQQTPQQIIATMILPMNERTNSSPTNTCFNIHEAACEVRPRILQRQGCCFYISACKRFGLFNLSCYPFPWARPVFHFLTRLWW